MIKFLSIGWLITALMFAVSLLINIILAKRRTRAINEHNKNAYERKKFVIELERKKGVYDEKIKKSKNTSDLISIYNDIMSNNNN